MTLFTICGESAGAKVIYNTSNPHGGPAPHVNRRPFRGVLAYADSPSDRAPAGARGHRVMLTRQAAETALPSLMGMGINYAPDMKRHDVRHKVGVITQAEVVGGVIEFSGFLYAKDYPEIVEKLERERMGVSYEISDAAIRDIKAKVWVVTATTFTGAAIISREKAAYEKAWIELT